MVMMVDKNVLVSILLLLSMFMDNRFTMTNRKKKREVYPSVLLFRVSGLYLLGCSRCFHRLNR
jgi:predicted membrane channel-forming protein YqfA (hemolysin III family)